jgi:hypothetical protein
MRDEEKHGHKELQNCRSSRRRGHSEPIPAMRLVCLALCLVAAGAVGAKLLKLTPIKCTGTFRMPSGTEVPAAFLSKEKLEILQDENDDSVITLCDVVPILIPDDPLRLTMSIAKDISLDKLAMLTNRDNGVYDNLPYKWGNKYTKKALYDYLNESKHKAVTLDQHFALFQKAMLQELDLVLTGLLVEIEDSFTDNRVSLGGAMVLSRSAFAPQYALTSTLLRPMYMASKEDEGEACVVNCRLDELVGFALASNLPVHISQVGAICHMLYAICYMVYDFCILPAPTHPYP